MTNPKIEKVKTAIARTKSVIADYQNKLRELEKQKIQFENDEIVALFRREKLNEDEFAQLLRANAKNSRVQDGTETIRDAALKIEKEENPDVFN